MLFAASIGAQTANDVTINQTVTTTYNYGTGLTPVVTQSFSNGPSAQAQAATAPRVTTPVSTSSTSLPNRASR